MNIQKISDSGMEAPSVGSVQMRGAGVQRPPVAQAPSDSVSISSNAARTAGFVEKVKSMPENRPEVVDSYRKQVDTNYPPPALINGFAKLLGSGAE